MIEPGSSSSVESDFRQIEDIIDSRKLLGQYDVRPPSLMLYTYSSYTSVRGAEEPPQSAAFNEGDPSTSSSAKHTDSEVTVVKVRRSEFSLWDDARDVATTAGDGAHLGADSPSMVNLATLVGDARRRAIDGGDDDEYLVPLSSWGPPADCAAVAVSSSKGSRSAPELTGAASDDGPTASWTGRIRRFVCRRCKGERDGCAD